MLRQATLFPHKDLASAFLSVERSALDEGVGLRAESAVKSLVPAEALAFVEAKQRALQRWRDSVSSLSQDAFNLSGRVVDVQVERQNFAELKRVNQTSTSLSIFLDLLLSDGESAAFQPTEAAEKLRSLKKTRQQIQRDNAALVSSLSTQHDSLTASLKEADQKLKELLNLSPLDATRVQSAARREALHKAVEEEERQSMTLLSTIQEIGGEGKHFEEALQQETSEIDVLRETIKARRQDTRTKQERREQEQQSTQQQLREVEEMCEMLVKMGGTEIEGIPNNPLILRLKTSVQSPAVEQRRAQSRCFEHQLKLELDPATFTVCAARLTPDEMISLENVAVGQSLASAVSHVRSLLFLVLNRRAHLEALSEYRFVEIKGEEGVWRAVLPNGMEAEILLPRNWPYEQDSEVRLLAVQGPSASICLRPAMAKVQEQHFTDLRALLQALSQELSVISAST